MCFGPRLGLWLMLALLGPFGCRPKPTDSSEVLATSNPIEWASLKPGQKFRISPSGQLSKCYLAGKTISLNQCGDGDYWQVRKQSNDQVKMIQSLIDFQCLAFYYVHPRPDLLLGTRPCNDGDADQMITHLDGRLSLAKSDGSHAGGYGEPVTFLVSDGDGMGKDPISSLIFASDVKMQGNTPTHSSFASEVRWGYVPRIKSIGVATARDEFVTALQVHYANGQSLVLGNCKLDRQGICEGIGEEDHPGHPNPIVLDDDEYVTDVGMKFAPYSGPAFFADRSDRLVEIMIKTNKAAAKKILWKGRGQGATSWQWLTSKNRYMIAGFIGKRAGDKGQFIQGLGVTYVDLSTYKAHNPDVFAPKGTVNAVDKSGHDLVGITRSNSRVRLCCNKTIQERRKKAYNDAFVNHQNIFSTTFYQGKMGDTARLDTVRVYFSGAKLQAITLQPHATSGNVQPEVYGEIPEHTTPQIYCQLKDNEHIASVQWKTGAGSRSLIEGTHINGLMLTTNSGKVCAYQDESVVASPWQRAFARSGYAIGGFFGLYSKDSVLGTNEILNLGPWYVKISELPGTSSATQQPVKSGHLLVDAASLTEEIKAAVGNPGNREDFVRALNDKTFALVSTKAAAFQLPAYNVLVFNTKQPHEANLEHIIYTEVFQFEDTPYRVWVFASGRFVNKGEGGYGNWAMYGFNDHNDGGSKEVNFRRP